MSTQFRPEQADLTKYWNFGSGTMGVPNGTEFPADPADGDVFYRTDQGTFYIYDGAAWDQSRTFGDIAGGNYAVISTGGVITLVGTAKRVLTLRPEINVDEIKKQEVPVQVHIGAGVFFGYSMPLWSDDPVDNHEELHFRQNVPGRWDGASDIVFHALVCLAALQMPGQKFNFQLDWNQAGTTDIVPVTVHPETDEITLIDATQFATYGLLFTLNYDEDAGDPIISHDLLSARLRRIDATGDEMDGEPVVLDWHTHYVVDKVFKAP